MIMIKLKDDVNFKKLEKLGFKYCDTTGTYQKVYGGYTLYEIRTWNRVLAITMLSGSITNNVVLSGLCELFEYLEFRS